MNLYTIKVNDLELEFRAESEDEAREIIRQTLPQSEVDYESLQETAHGIAED